MAGIMEEIKYCMCGCGQEVSYTKRNYVNDHAKKIINAPLCACGCGQNVKWDKWKCEWNKFISGHLIRDEKMRQKMSESAKKRLPESFYQFNRPLDEEIKNKISKTLKGRFVGESSPNYGRKHTEEAKAILRELAKKRVGEKAANWKGGIHPIYQKIRNCDKYIEWRFSVFERDKFLCSRCGKKSNGDLNAHHKKAFIQIIKRNKIETIEEAVSCNELWDVENGITLCKRCHQKEHKI